MEGSPNKANGRFRRLFLPWMIILIGMMMSCGRGGAGGNSGEESVEFGDTVSRLDTDLTYDARQWADSVLSGLSVSEKAAQLFMPAVYAEAGPADISRVRKYARAGVGGIVLLKGDCAGASALVDSLVRMSAIPPFVSIDAEWGLAMRLADAPRFPANGSIDEKVGEELMYDYGAELARECRKLGINMVLGPVIDVDSGGGFIGKRSFGMDPERVSMLSTAYAQGLSSGGILSVAKHFPGHGSVSTDSHKDKGVISRSLHSLSSIDLRPFRNWIRLQLPGIMVGHLAVPSIDPDMLPAAVSPAVINDLLRHDLGFSGLVLTDALNMGGAEGYGPDKALEAGADIIIAPVDTYSGIRLITQAVEEGRIPEERLDEAVGRILSYKYLYCRERGETSATDSVSSQEAKRIAAGLRHASVGGEN